MNIADLLKLLHDRARHLDAAYANSELAEAIREALAEAAAPTEVQS